MKIIRYQDSSENIHYGEERDEGTFRIEGDIFGAYSSTDEVADHRLEATLEIIAGHEHAQARVGLDEARPERVVAHLDRLIERERLGLEVKAKTGKRLLVPIEKLRRFAANDTIERGHSLLAVQQELHDTRCEVATSAMGGRFRLGGPHE